MLSTDELCLKAKEVRRHIIQMLAKAGSGHPGGSLSAADILTVLYFNKMNHDPKNPNWEDRDRFVLSKGHAAPTLYTVLALTGYFPVSELKTLRKLNSRLQGHPSSKLLEGIEVSTGSLGQGLSMAVGMALAGKMDKKDYKVYSLIGDGETQEGQIWEAAMCAAHYKLNNLIVFTDRNNLQIDGFTKDIMSLGDLVYKWISFGWDVYEINGNKIEEIISVLNDLKENDKPKMIIANTIKGSGVSFMENVVGWHGVAPKKEEAEKALEELK